MVVAVRHGNIAVRTVTPKPFTQIMFVIKFHCSPFRYSVLKYVECNYYSKPTQGQVIMIKTFIQIRGYFPDCTVSDVYDYTGQKIGYALEDVARPPGVKIAGETCIPEAIYDVAITYSNKYGKDMIQLYNKAEDLSIEKHGVRFVGVRVHGGNTVDDSEGCPLVAKNFDGDAKVWQSISKETTETIKSLIAAGYSVKWCITSP